jgi:hypothetical protein
MVHERESERCQTRIRVCHPKIVLPVPTFARNDVVYASLNRGTEIPPSNKSDNILIKGDAPRIKRSDSVGMYLSLALRCSDSPAVGQALLDCYGHRVDARLMSTWDLRVFSR